MPRTLEELRVEALEQIGASTVAWDDDDLFAKLMSYEQRCWDCGADVYLPNDKHCPPCIEGAHDAYKESLR